VLTTLCWLPQLVKTRGLSLPTTGAFTLGIMLWLIYGLAIGDWPLIGSNAATLVLMAPVLALKLRYGQGELRSFSPEAAVTYRKKVVSTGINCSFFALAPRLQPSRIVWDRAIRLG
jgi:MtN3 and saliva related transmembrane protein